MIDKTPEELLALPAALPAVQSSTSPKLSADAICSLWVSTPNLPEYKDCFAPRLIAYTRKLEAAIRQPAALPVPANNFVQPVPDHCDRITWRDGYYHLPINQAAQPVPPDR